MKSYSWPLGKVSSIPFLPGLVTLSAKCSALGDALTANALLIWVLVRGSARCTTGLIGAAVATLTADSECEREPQASATAPASRSGMNRRESMLRNQIRDAGR